MDPFVHKRAEQPILVSIPHAGMCLEDGLSDRLTAEACDLPDTDWYVDRLYDFLDDTPVGVLRAKYSRYVVDLNRSPDNELLYPGQHNSEICPTQTFNGAAIYMPGLEPAANEIENRIARYWAPYHDCLQTELDRLRQQFGFAILWDAHSIPSRMPLLFDGELPQLNIGTDGGRSCDPELSLKISNALAASSYSTVVNGRFRGGYITRHYGVPNRNLHAIQLEIAQRAYMNESDLTHSDTKSDQLRVLLRQAFDILIQYGGKAPR